MDCSFEGIGHMRVTFPDGGCTEGKVCKLNSAGSAVDCSAGDLFCGVAEVVRGGLAGVQIHGFAVIGYSGTAPTAGYVSLSADGSGGVKTDAAGKRCLVAQVDTAANTVTVEL